MSVTKRHTRQRDAVIAVIRAASCHLTAEEIHLRIRRRPRPIGLATVYRALEAFVQEGMVEPVYLGDGPLRYGLAANHHDHLVCLRCGTWQALPVCPIPRSPRRLARGFWVVGHTLALLGYCPQCQASGARDRTNRSRRVSSPGVR